MSDNQCSRAQHDLIVGNMYRLLVNTIHKGWQDLPPEKPGQRVEWLELRNCVHCNSTLAIPEERAIAIPPTTIRSKLNGNDRNER